MHSSDHRSIPFDVGLLSPVTAGSDALVADDAIAAALVEVEVALARASAELGIIPSASAETIARALDGYRPDAAVLARAAVGGGNPVIPLLPQLRERVAELDQESAIRLHRGATSQDILDTALMLIAQRAIATVSESLRDAAVALARLADTHRETVMAGRTLTQHSTPTTFGLVAAGWLLAVIEAREGIVLALPAQLAGASGTLASFVELGGADAALDLPARFAQKLGLAAPVAPWHGQRGPVTRIGDALTTVVDAMGAIASNIAILSRTEVGEVSEPGGDGRGGSSAMPQKQNPILSVLVRSAAMRAPGLGADLHRSSALAAEQRPDGAWHAEWPVLRELLRLALGSTAMVAELLSGLQVDSERMRANLEITGPLIVSERLALVLDGRLGASRSKSLVTRIAAGEDAREILAAEPDLESVDIDALLDPAHYTGAAGPLIDAALARAAESGARP